jgi:hypothetical protein
MTVSMNISIFVFLKWIEIEGWYKKPILNHVISFLISHSLTSIVMTKNISFLKWFPKERKKDVNVISVQSFRGWTGW